MIENRLPQLLYQQDISIRELARRTGITYTTVRAVVQGERRSVQLDVIEEICRVLGVQPGDIYSVPGDIRKTHSYREQDTDSQPDLLPPRQSGVKKHPIVNSNKRDRRTRKKSSDWRTW